MIRIMMTAIAGTLFYGFSASLCFAGLFRIYDPGTCTTFCEVSGPATGYIMLFAGLVLFIVFLLSLFRTAKGGI